MAQAPERVNMWTDPIGWLREHAEKTAAQAGKDEFGRQNSPGWVNDTLGALTGATDAGTQEYVDAAETQKLKDTWEPLLNAQGLEWKDTYTAATASEAIEAAKRQKNNTTIVEQQELTYNSPSAVDERMTRDRRYYDQQKENAQLRLDQIRREDRRERKEDQRYNERLLLEQKQNRRQAMQSLTAGLASLGAAFAL